jgi:bacteriocin biosynthesis cyclodehydratase domain-containing protein
MTEPPSVVRVVSVGPFGRAVAGYLRRLRGDALEMSTDAALSTERSPPARMIVVAAWRPVVYLCDRCDQFSHDRGTPFLPLIADSANLTLGPIVVPGCGSCWSCYRRRLRQHGEWLEGRSALSEHYVQRSETGPQGYLDPFALIGAARIAQIIDALDSEAAQAGRVWQIDMVTREIVTSTVTGIHGCPRCGLHRRSETLSTAELRQHLAYLWPACP